MESDLRQAADLPSGDILGLAVEPTVEPTAESERSRLWIVGRAIDEGRQRMGRISSTKPKGNISTRKLSPSSAPISNFPSWQNKGSNWLLMGRGGIFLGGHRTTSCRSIPRGAPLRSIPPPGLISEGALALLRDREGQFLGGNLPRGEQDPQLALCQLRPNATAYCATR